jgi:coproporphyrinogen III oxidase
MAGRPEYNSLSGRAEAAKTHRQQHNRKMKRLTQKHPSAHSVRPALYPFQSERGFRKELLSSEPIRRESQLCRLGKGAAPEKPCYSSLMSDLKLNRESIVDYLKALRDQVCSAFESLEDSGSRFQRSQWPYQKGEGGGEMSVLRGQVFEKAAVNWSGVSGDVFPGTPAGEKKEPFFATGLSLITHMANPKAPTVHFNIRYIEKGSGFWLGGGFDLTPMGFPYDEDTRHFHAVAEKSLSPFGRDLYPKFSQAAKEYFFIKHYDRERGVGGIFFDHYRSGNPQKDLQMWQSVGDHFLESILPIYQKRIPEPFTPADRQTQLRRRAHYVEFNLLYDRGTKFGFESGGNPEAILCSMPPLAAW